MSLINQVLQNVEKRHGALPSNPTLAGAPRTGFAQVLPVLGEQSTALTGVSWRWLALGSLLALVAWLVTPGIVQWRAQAQALSALDQFPPAAGGLNASQTGSISGNPSNVNQGHPTDRRLTRFLFSDWQTAGQTVTSEPRAAKQTAAPATTQLALMASPHRLQPEGNAIDSDAAQISIATLTAPKTSLKSVVYDKEAVTKRIQPEQEVNVWIQRAVDAEQKGRVSEALTLLRQAVASYPSSEDARLLLVNLYQENKQEAEALNLLQAGIKAYPEQAMLRKTLAKWQLAHGQAGLAIETLQPMATNAGQDMDWQWMQAMAHQQIGQHQAALPYFERAIQLQPAHAQAYVAYAVSLQALGMRTQALQQLRFAQDFPMSERMSEFVLQRTQQLSQMAER